MSAIHLSLCLSVVPISHELTQCVLKHGPFEFHGDRWGTSDSRRPGVAAARMDRKETAGLMKEEPGTVLSEQGWLMDGGEGGLGERRETRRPAVPLEWRALC